MKRAVFFVQRIGPYHAARFREAATRLKENNIEFYVVETCAQDHIYKWDTILDNGEYHRITLFNKVYTEIGIREMYSKFFEVLNKLKPDVLFVSGWSSRESYISLFWSKIKGKKRVVVSESSSIDVKRSYNKELFKKIIIKLYHAGFVGGKSHEDYLVNLGMKRDAVFRGYDAVDNAYFTPGKENAYNPDGYILASGRYIERKNFIGLINAYYQYRKVVDTPKNLMLCGSGELEFEINTEIEKLGLQDYVITPGFVQYHELPKIYQNASVYIIPSLSEQWGLVVNEAMASGLPVLAADVCGSTIEVVKNGVNGYTFNSHSLEEITNVLQKFDELLPSKKLDLSKKALECIANFGVEKFANGVLLSVNAVLK